jgi:hypothetical protein
MKRLGNNITWISILLSLFFTHQAYAECISIYNQTDRSPEVFVNVSFGGPIMQLDPEDDNNHINPNTKKYFLNPYVHFKDATDIKIEVLFLNGNVVIKQLSNRCKPGGSYSFSFEAINCN